MTKKHARRAMVTVVAAVSMVFALVGSAFAQAYPPGGFVTCDTTAAGATSTCVIDGLDGEDSVDVTVTLVSADVNAAAAPALASTALAQDVTVEGTVLFDDTVSVNDDGEATVVFDIPADAQAGDQLVFVVNGETFVGTATLPVTAAGTAGPGTSTPIAGAADDQLPRTGLEIGVLIAIAAAALVVGGGAIAASRRKGDAAV